MLDDRSGPGAWKPSRRFDPSGSVASRPPRSSRRSISSRTLENAGEASRASSPAAGGEAAVRAHQMLAARAHAGASYEFGRRIVERDEERAAANGSRAWRCERQRARIVEALVGQIGTAVDA